MAILLLPLTPCIPPFNLLPRLFFPPRELSEGYVYAYLGNSDAPDRAEPPCPHKRSVNIPRAMEIPLETPPRSGSSEAKRKGALPLFEGTSMDCIIALSDSEEEEEEGGVAPLRGRVGLPPLMRGGGASQKGGQRMTPSQAAGQAALRRLGAG